MTTSSFPRRGGGTSPSEVAGRIGTADAAALDRPGDQARLEGALEGYDAARRCPPNPVWRARMAAALRARRSRTATTPT